MSAPQTPRAEQPATDSAAREPIADDAPTTTAEAAEGSNGAGDNAASDEVKSYDKARDAFRRGDVAATIAEHDKRAPEKHASTDGGMVKSIVFGGLDGIITTFAVVSAAAGAGETWKVVLVFGFANAIADAWSMGFGGFISSLAEQDHAKSERERELWEVDNAKEGEIKEMIEIYENKGFPREDAEALVAIISKDRKRFVDIMMVEELGILVDEDEGVEGPLKQGVVMFLSFIFFGIFPLLAYCGGKGKGVDWVFGLACGITGVGLMVLGAAKGFLTGESIPVTALKMLINGGISGGVSFGTGVLVSYIVDGEVKFG